MKVYAPGKTPLPATIFECLYGQGKTMKTTTALLAPPSFRPIDYLDADKGAAIRLRLLSLTAEERTAAGVEPNPLYEKCGPWVGEGITFYVPEDERYYADLWEFVEAAAKSPSRLIVVDTISRIGDGILQEVTATPVEKADGKETAKAKLETPGGASTYIRTQQDFGLAQDRLMEWLKLLVDKCPNKNILLLSHEKTGEVKDSTGAGRILAGPRSIGNALIEVIPGIVDLALRLEPRVKMVQVAGKQVQEATVAVRARNHNIYLAGDRSGMFKDGETFDPFDHWVRIERILRMNAPQGA